MQPRPIVVFLKAAIPGGAAADLFSAPVMVGGHVLAATGTYVAPHASHRMKRRPEAAKPQRQAAPDLFSQPPPKPTPEPAAPEGFDPAAWWDGYLTSHGRSQVSNTASVHTNNGRTKWRHLQPATQAKIIAAYGRIQDYLRLPGGEEPVAPTAAAPDLFRFQRRAPEPPPAADHSSGPGEMVPEPPASEPPAAEAPPPDFADLIMVDDMRAIRAAAAEAAGLDWHSRDQGKAAVLVAVLRTIRAREAVPPGMERAAATAIVATMIQDAQRAAAREVPQDGAGPEPYRPTQWGMRAGVKPAERIRANQDAERILAAKPDDADITDEDREALARYTGWGGCGTSPNEYFTPPEVARAMWTVLAKLGHRGGEALEPSAGTGVFQQVAPAGTRMTAVELSATSARINRVIHGQRDEVQGGTLEAFAGWDQRKFDVVIGNPPFGDRTFSRYDDLADGKTTLARAEHYFIDTALDKAKDGGLVALIVPNGVMDNPSARDFRARMLAKGQFITAFRLPNSAFKDSHTEVTTDIIILRKRPQPIASALAALTPTQQALLPHWDEQFVAGRHMLDGPGAQNVMGRTEAGWRAKLGMGNDITVTGSMLDVPETIAAWQPEAAQTTDNSPPLSLILDTAGDRRAAVERASATEPYPRLTEGETKVEGGILYVLRNSRWHRAEEPEAEAVADARRVAALLEPVIDGTAPDMALARAKLIEGLDAFTGKHGNPARVRELLDWTSSPNLPTGGADAAHHAGMVGREARRVSLLLGAVRADGTYSDAVTGNQGGPVGSLETVATGLAAQKGEFTAAALAAAARTEPAEVEDFLHAHQGFARIPGGDSWTSMDAYLAGDLWPKHDAAVAAARDPELPAAERDRMQRQADALYAAIGWTDLGDVTNIQLDSPFVSHECIAAWKTAQDGRGRDWVVREDRGVISVKTEGYYSNDTDDLLEKVLMRRGVRKDDAHLVEDMHTSFREWLLADPDWRAKVEAQYNRTFRGYVPRTYSDEPIPTPGLNPEFSVHGYQWRGVRWAMERGKGIIAADVGVGKTPRALILNQLLRATGRAKKPVIVMPKSLLSNWHDMVGMMFPGAKVLTIGETLTQDKDGKLRSREDDEPTRRRKLAELAQNDHDFVLMTLPAWNMLNLDEDRRAKWESEEFFNQRREALEEAAASRKKTKGQLKREVKTQEKFESKQDRARFLNKGETNITLEATGIDAVIMDEGHSMKNLATPEAGAFKDLRFLGAPNEPSKQAANSYYKFRHIREKAGGGNVFMLTATPTKNSPLEIYSMMQHVAPEVWHQMGIRNADDFISRFVESENDMILSPTGEAVEANVVTGFRNLDEVRQVARRYIDRTTAAEVGLKLPTPEVIEHQVEADQAQIDAYNDLRPRLAEALKDKEAEGIDHPFSIISDMQKAAMDMRLYEPDRDHPPSPKLRAIADNVAKLHKEGGQLVFCEYVGGHRMLHDLMVARGMDPKRIGIINAEATPSSAARQRLCDAFNAGELDCLIGNVTMSEGLNAQKRTTDIHHADIPWEPATIIQRNGRGLRQGNKNAGIRLHSYLTSGTFDGYRWQSMMSKSDWQTAFWGGGNTAENTMRGSLGRLEMLIFSAADPAEARAKFAAQLEAAKDRREVAQRAEAARLWGRYREAKRQLDKMQRKRQLLGRKEPTEPETRLAARVDGFRARLGAHPDFPWKDQIDAASVLIDQKTGRVWRPGDEVEVAPGARFRTYSKEPESFRVHHVDEITGKVALIPAGEVRDMDTKPFSTRIADMAELREGVSPTKIDRDAAAARHQTREAEREAARRAAAEAKARAEADAQARERVAKVERMMAGGDPVHPADLRAMGEAWMAEHRDAVRAKLREAADKHRIPGYASHHVIEAADGSVRTIKSYDIGKLGPDEHLALPTAATRDKLIQAAVQSAVDSPLEHKHAPVPGKRNYGRVGEYQGARRAHIGDTYANESPELDALKQLFRDEHGAEAGYQHEVAARADAIAADRVRGATAWWQALDAARGGFHDLSPYSYRAAMRGGDLQPQTAAALMEAAERLGVAHQGWNERATSINSWPRQSGSAYEVQRALTGGTPYGTVRDTLARFAKPANDPTQRATPLSRTAA